MTYFATAVFAFWLGFIVAAIFHAARKEND